MRSTRRRKYVNERGVAVEAWPRVSDERLDLRIANDLGALARVAERVDAFCMAHGVPRDCAFKLNVALEELLTNTISYGYDDARPHAIAIAIAREGDILRADISDDARAFDPRQAAPPDLETPLAERRIGGLGVHLVRTLMDEVAYAYRDGRNCVTLRKRISPESGQKA